MTDDDKTWLSEKFGKVDLQFDEVRQQFGKVEQQFGKVEQQFGKVEQQFGKVEQQFNEVKQQVGKVEQRLDSLEAKVDRNDASLRKEWLATEHRMVEVMRDMQTELLRGFQAFAVPQNIRLRKVEVDQSNLDSSMSGRMEVLEKRLYQIEMRLFGGDQEGTAKH